MGIIIPLFAPGQQPSSEAAARRRADRLARASAEDMRAGLELLCVFDPVGFDVALPARSDPDEGAEPGEPVVVCGRCGGLVALFAEDLIWRHYRGALDVGGVQAPFDAGHAPTVEWYLLEEIPEELIA